MTARIARKKYKCTQCFRNCIIEMERLNSQDRPFRCLLGMDHKVWWREKKD